MTQTYTIIRGDKVITTDRQATEIGRVEQRYGGWLAFGADDEEYGWSGDIDQAVRIIEVEAGLRPPDCSTCGASDRVTLHHPTILDQSIDICAVCGSDQ